MCGIIRLAQIVFFMLALMTQISYAQQKPIDTNSVFFQRPYILGVVAFNQERFEDAIVQFRRALKYIPDESAALTYLMFSGFQLEDGATTTEAGEKLITQGKDSGRTLFITAKGYRLAGDEQKAREYFGRIADREDDPYVDAAEFALAETGLNYRPKGFRGSAIFGAENDSNVASAPDQDIVGAQDIDDSRLVGTLQLSYNHRLGARYHLGSNLAAWIQSYSDDASGAFAYSTTRGDLHGGVVGQGWDLQLTAEQEILDRDRADYLESLRYKLVYNQKITDSYRLTIRGDLSDDDYKGVYDPQDGESTSYGLQNRFMTPEVVQGSYFSLDFNSRRNETPSLSIYSFDAVGAKLSFFSPLPKWSLYTNIHYRGEERTYDKVAGFSDREDTAAEWYFKLGKFWSRKLRSEAFYQLYDNDSNLVANTYEKVVYGAQVIYGF